MILQCFEMILRLIVYTLFYKIYNTVSVQQALLLAETVCFIENRARVDDGKLAFKFLPRNPKLNIPCDSDKRNENELFVCSKYCSTETIEQQ